MPEKEDLFFFENNLSFISSKNIMKNSENMKYNEKLINFGFFFL